MSQAELFTEAPSRLARTRAAIAQFEATDAERSEMLFSGPLTQEAYDLWRKAEDGAITLVREAFYLDTQDINSREHAFLVHPRDKWLLDAIQKETL